MNVFKNIIIIFLVCSLFPQDLFAGNIKGKVILKGKKSHANAVVYIDKIPGKKFKPPKEPAIMDQKNLEFVPHVLPVLVGTTVEFHNSDDVLHNVYCPNACANKFDLGTWAKGKVKTYTFDNPGCEAVLLCNIHPAMEAYVLVLETPYFAVTAKDGSFLIKDVPEGKFTLRVWHKRFKGSNVAIDVPGKGEINVDFELIKDGSQ